MWGGLQPRWSRVPWGDLLRGERTGVSMAQNRGQEAGPMVPGGLMFRFRLEGGAAAWVAGGGYSPDWG